MSSLEDKMPEADVLVIGIGPAGGAFAAFAGQYDLKIIAVAKAPGTADTPRAHILNPFGMQCLRELGLEDEAMQVASVGPLFKSMRWCDSITGQEYGRVRYWGTSPENIHMGETVAATPCDYVDLPQSRLEPLLVRKATDSGRVSLHFNTTFVSFKRETGSKTIVSTVKDNLTGREYQIRSRFLIGADGGRSEVARSMGVEFDTVPAPSANAVNIMVEADCNHLMLGREAQLTWCVGAPSQRKFGGISCMRMIKPWSTWLLIFVEAPDGSTRSYKTMTRDDPELIQLVRETIGDDDVPIRITKIDPWVLRESVAKSFQDGRDIFLLGDAAHRHTPAFGLGSNTSMQDAYNLAWKIAFVAKGLAGPELLDSFTPERQPVGTKLVKASTRGFASHIATWKALGTFAPTYEEGKAERDELASPTQDGEERRALLHTALEGIRTEAESLGMQMNQQYISNGIYLEDEGPRPDFAGDPVINSEVTTYPGSRLPHAWLTGKVPSQKISTIDLAGFGAFTILTGHGGTAWKDAAVSISKQLGVPIKAYGIGWGLDYHDKYRDWIKKREIQGDGCLLVRPDNFVAWRSVKMIGNCEEKLSLVLKTILSRRD